jgi:hypothetical protein
MQLRPIGTLMVLLLLAPATARGQGCPSPLIVVDPDGHVSAGSKERLRAAAAAGLPLRVGWSIDGDHDGKPDLSHWADATFVTEFEGEVFAQVPEIRGQTPRRGERHVELSATPRRWTGSVGSDGILEGAFDDERAPTRTRVRVIMCVDPRVPQDMLPAALRRPTER